MYQVQIQEFIVRFHAVNEGSNAGESDVDSSLSEHEGLGFRVEGSRRDGHLAGSFVGVGRISEGVFLCHGQWIGETLIPVSPIPYQR